MKKNIAIIAGGYSSEYEVSVRSARNLYGFIDRERYSVYIILIERDRWLAQLPDGGTAPVDRNDFSFRMKDARIRIDYAYVTIHGTPGENGLLQGYFDMLGIPCSSCGTLASALTFNKYLCNRLMSTIGVRVPDAVRLRRGEAFDGDGMLARLGLPVFVKPNDSGSSFGVSRVDEASQLQAAVDKAFEESDEVVIERFIPGVEVTCGCLRTKGEITALPVTEVVSTRVFFDYDAKYNGESQEITPARISPALTATVQQTTAAIYDFVGARGIIRVDYIIPDDGNPVLLEINTTPGMTDASFIPQQVQAAGLEMKDMLTGIIENE
ncbi:MAG: D-alanine--D-alanine ligase [Tannerella sp.]|jgi:D-alanine-D-alanine ligase|nr:D-alanine--D-alanine ligase [Tannerella sp.]